MQTSVATPIPALRRGAANEKSEELPQGNASTFASDAGPAHRVRSAIADTYRRCRARAHGDALFQMVWSEVASGLYQDHERAAALVVTCYFFDACDIFESPDP